MTARLKLERLEDRTTPAAGLPWLDARSLTLSFAPDGADVAGKGNVLNAAMDAALGAGWKDTVLSAFQTWAAQANIDVAVVADDGSAFGVAAPMQADPRFGDIRIGARPMGTTDVAETVSPDWAAGSWSGDIVFNTNFDFKDGYDLFTVALHEAGRAFGLAGSDDKASVMYGAYQGAFTGLSAGDVAAIKSLYGSRLGDLYEGKSGNGTFDRATKIDRYNGPSSGFNAVVRGEVTSAADVDTYSFTAASGATAVRLRTSDVSLLAGRLSLYDQNRRLVNTVTGKGDLEIFGNLSSGKTYYVVVQGATGGPSGAGRYVLTAGAASASPVSGRVSSSLASFVAGYNKSIYTAQQLGGYGYGGDGDDDSGNISQEQPVLAATGRLLAAADRNFFKFKVGSDLNGMAATIGVWSADGDRFPPRIAVYDSSGRAVATQTLVAQNGAFVVQIANAKANATYYYSVGVREGAVAGGKYITGVAYQSASNNFDDRLAVAFDPSTPQAESRLSVDRNALIHFVGSTTGAAGQFVNVSLFDAAGNLVRVMSFKTGDTFTFDLFLQAGDYRVAFAAATLDGTTIAGAGFSLAMQQMDGNIDPVAVGAGATPAPTAPRPPKTYAVQEAVKVAPTLETTAYADPYAM